MASGDVTLKRGTSVALTITLGSLASSSTRVAGRESTAVTPADPVIDHLVGGKVTVGTAPTVNKQIDVWVYAELDDAPAYPDTITGADGARTLTSENVRNAALVLARSIQVDATSDRLYYIAPFSVAELFGGKLPGHWGLFVTHDTGVALNATGSNHVLKTTPVYANVTP